MIAKNSIERLFKKTLKMFMPFIKPLQAKNQAETFAKGVFFLFEQGQNSDIPVKIDFDILPIKSGV